MAVLKDLIVHGNSRFLNIAQFKDLIADTGRFQKLTTNVLGEAGQTISVYGIMNVEGELNTKSWTNANIATVGGNMYICPTISIAEGSTGIVTVGSGTLTFSPPSGSSFALDNLLGGDSNTSSWTQNSLVLVTGEILYNNEYLPMGTLKGTIGSGVSTSSFPITNVTNNKSTGTTADIFNLIPAGSYTYRNLKISIYEVYTSSKLYPLGIYFTAMGSNGRTFIDIYGGNKDTDTATAGAGNLAEPNVRIGNLKGLPQVMSTYTPTGWGIYTNNGYFTGTIVAKQGKIGDGSAAWTIGNDTNSGAAYIYTGTRGNANSAYISTGLGTESIADSGVLSGTKWAYTAGANFGVTTNGTLYAKNAQISGSVAATNGFTVTSATTNGITLASMTTSGITLGDTTAANNKFNILITDSAVSGKGPGILLRRGTNVLNEITTSGVNVYVDGDTVAQFGETVKIGKISSRQTNISVDRDGLKLNYTGWYSGPLNTTTTAIVCGIYGYAGSPIVEKRVARIPGNATVTLQYIPTSGSQIKLMTSSSAGTRILTTFTAGTAETYTSNCKIIYDGEKTLTFSKITGRTFASANVNVYYYTNEDANRTKGGYLTIGTSVDNPFINTLTIGSYLQTTRDQQLILGQYNEPDETAYITIGTGTSSNDLLNEFVIRNIKDLVLDTKAYTVKNDYNLEDFWYPAPGAAQTINVYSSEDDSLITTIEKTASSLSFHIDSSYGIFQTDSIYYSYIPYSEGLGLSIGKNNQTGQYSIASGLNITTIGYGAIGHGLGDNDGSILSNGIGSLAQGYSTGEGLISTSGPGSIASGYSDQGMITAQGGGTLSLGYTYHGGIIAAKKRSSIALGFANLTGKIISAGVSAIAGGMTSRGTIRTRTNASIAFGIAKSDSMIMTYGSTGSVAMGVAYNGYAITTDRIDNTDPMDGAYAMGIAYGGNLSAEAAGARAVNESTIAAKRAQTAMGSLNIRDDSLTTTHPSGDTHYGQYALIIGNGVVGGSRSNALTIDWNGNIIGQGMAGMVQMFAGATAPTGWLICDGAAVSRETYATLFAVIGTTYGVGDGSTTFNLPDLRSRMPIGAGQGTDLTNRALASLGGSEYIQQHQHGFTNPTIASSGAHVHTLNLRNAGTSGNRTTNNVTYGASGHDYQNSNPFVSSGSHSHTYSANGAVGNVKDISTGQSGNMPPYIGINFIICTGKTS